MADVFVSYVPEDADWVRALAGRLAGYGLDVFFAEWSVLPGDVVVHGLERGLRESRSGIAVVSPASVVLPRALEEYAALIQSSADRGLRLIPVLLGDVDLPPFAANRVWRDFRNVHGQAYDDKVRELAAVICGQAPGGDGPMAVPPENLAAALPAAPHPVTEPDQHAFVVCYAADDVTYGRQLAGQLRQAGLPVWSVGDLRPGDVHFWKIRQQLAYAVAVVVVMSPRSQDSEDITRMILEGVRHGRPFVPVLLQGERNYHLANTWYVDARNGRLLGDDELAMVARLHQADAAGCPADPAQILPAPLAQPPVRVVRVPAAAALDRLNGYLGERELGHADLLTTALLLESAGRLGEGWMRERDGRQLPLDLLAGIDALWSAHTRGRQGFAAQRGLAQARSGRHAEFRALSLAYGWTDPAPASVPRHYRDFADRAGPGPRAGFFPTLRNPQSEQYLDWYDQWTATVLAVHLRLRQSKDVG